MTDRRYARKTPCESCPFGKNTPPGETGGADPMVYIGQAMGPFLLPCHADPDYEKNPRDPELMQCAGAAMYRASTGVAVLMPAVMHHLENDGRAFASHEELLAHHEGISLTEARRRLRIIPPAALLVIEMQKAGCLPVAVRPRDEAKSDE